MLEGMTINGRKEDMTGRKEGRKRASAHARVSWFDWLKTHQCCWLLSAWTRPASVETELVMLGDNKITAFVRRLLSPVGHRLTNHGARDKTVSCVSVNKHPVGCEAQLAWKCLNIHAHFFGGRSRLEFSVCSGYHFATLVNIQTHRQTASWLAYMNTSVNGAETPMQVYRYFNIPSKNLCIRWREQNSVRCNTVTQIRILY